LIVLEGTPDLSCSFSIRDWVQDSVSDAIRGSSVCLILEAGMLFWNRITQLERLRVRRITLAMRQTFAADQSSSIVAFFVLGGLLQSLHIDLDTDLVAEFEAVGDGFCWIEHANDCPCNPVPILYIYSKSRNTVEVRIFI
jgi:hypothetical protein